MKPIWTWPAIPRGMPMSRLTSARLTSSELPGETVCSATLGWPTGTKSGGNGNASGKRSSSDQRPFTFSSPEMRSLKPSASWTAGSLAVLGAAC